jgi:methylisocitrate lyase
MSKAAEIIYKEIKSQGTQKQVVDNMQTRAELYEVLNYHEYEEKLDTLFVEENSAKKNSKKRN